MNWLAHLFLSEKKTDFQLGNILNDPMKGRYWIGASNELIRGMKTHQKIDSFTDSHDIVSKSKKCLREKGLLKAVVIDLTYDYFLTKNWHVFSPISLEEYLSDFYKKAALRKSSFPIKAKDFVSNLIVYDFLSKYKSMEDLEKSFLRMDKRLSPRLLKRESASSYYPAVCSNIDVLEKDFLKFFPLLCLHVKKNLDPKHLSHWKAI